MILDTSAILAILFDEPDRELLLDKLGRASSLGIGAPTLVEAGIVLRRARRARPDPQLNGFVELVDAVVISFERVHWHTAVGGWLRFGKGRHPGALNFGDSLAYATARVAAEPLLCKGDDFAKTDLTLA